MGKESEEEREGLSDPICSLQQAGGYTGCLGCDQHCETTALTKSGQTTLSGDNPGVQEGLRLDGFRLRRVSEMKQEGKKISMQNRVVPLQVSCDSCPRGH